MINSVIVVIDVVIVVPVVVITIGIYTIKIVIQFFFCSFSRICVPGYSTCVYQPHRWTHCLYEMDPGNLDILARTDACNFVRNRYNIYEREISKDVYNCKPKATHCKRKLKKKNYKPPLESEMNYESFFPFFPLSDKARLIQGLMDKISTSMSFQY